MTLDVGLAVAVVLVGLWRETRFPAGDRRMVNFPVAVYATVQVLGGITLLARRRWPLAAGLTNAVLNLISPTQASFVAAYTLGAHAKSRRRGIGTFVVLTLCWILGAQLWRLEDPFGGPILLALALVIGLYVHARRSLLDELYERAVRAERDQRHLAEQAVAAERLRIASDMHGVVSHEVTLVVLQAGALSVASPYSDVRDAAEEIRGRGVAALRDLRNILGLLRSDVELPADPDMAPSSRPGMLADLIEPAVRAGTQIQLEEHGRPLSGEPIVRLIRQIVQEGVTNAIKHAPGSRICIRLHTGLRVVAVEVLNSQPTLDIDAALSGSGSGTGLTVLRADVQTRGGIIEFGQQDTGGFALRVTLPTDASPVGCLEGS